MWIEGWLSLVDLGLNLRTEQWLEDILVIGLTLLFLYALHSPTEFDAHHVYLFLMMIVWQARQSLIVRGLFPMLADPRHPVRIILYHFLNYFSPIYLERQKKVSFWEHISSCKPPFFCFFKYFVHRKNNNRSFANGPFYIPSTFWHDMCLCVICNKGRWSPSLCCVLSTIGILIFFWFGYLPHFKTLKDKTF